MTTARCDRQASQACLAPQQSNDKDKRWAASEFMAHFFERRLKIETLETRCPRKLSFCAKLLEEIDLFPLIGVEEKPYFVTPLLDPQPLAKQVLLDKGIVVRGRRVR